MKKKIVLPVLLFLFSKALSQSDSASRSIDSLDAYFAIPLFNSITDDGENTIEQQDVSSLLLSSRDVFAQFASFQFGAARYKMRGASARNTQITINGIVVNSPETGSASWSSWGGLNDVTRFAETRIGITASRYSFSAMAGYVNIDSRASSFKKGTRISYSSANRIYRNRVMCTYSTGMLKNGWAFSLSASNRYGNNVYVPGTYFNGNGFYFSADKKLGNKHLLGITSFCAPVEQGRTSTSTKETYRLAETNFYNSNWGLQNGKPRNASVSKNSRPTFIISDVISINEDTRINISVYYNFGRSSISGLTWYDAPNPDPDYYRYLPSYYYQTGDSLTGDQYLSRWQLDENFRQINWDKLITMNQANLYTDPHLLGQGVNTTETRARYIVEKRVEQINNLGSNVVFNKRIKNFFLSAGINGNIYENRKYKEIEDLLGSTYWVDVDQFAENLGVEEYLQQNDLDNPNKKVKEGDKFGYDYSIIIRKCESWAQAEYSGKQMDYYFAASGSASTLLRNGHVANGKFPNSSKGNSEMLQFFNGALKGGFTFKINGRHFITGNVLKASRTPDNSAIFISPRVRNTVVKDLQNEQITSSDLNYHVKYPSLKVRATYYYNVVNNQTWLRTYWHDTYNTNVNLIMKNVDQIFQGLELGLEKAIKTQHIIQAAFAVGEFQYSNRPTLEAWQDNNSSALFEERQTYLKGYKVGGSPQMVGGVGYKFMANKFWFAGLYGNYIGDIYIEPNPDRRTNEAAGKFQTDEIALAQEIVQQEKLPGYFILNANAGKSYRIKKKYSININLSINNILNNKNIIIGGFESLRWDPGNVNKFQNKYTYLPGISYMLIVNLTF